MDKQKDKETKPWTERATFVVLDRNGKIIDDFRFEDSAQGWQTLNAKLGKHPDLAVTIETSSGATTNAKSMLAVTLAKRLRVLQNQLDKYRKRITELFKKHPHYALFGSLPSAGEKLAPRLLAELGDHRDRFESADLLRCYAGTAPVSFQSGQIRRVHFRRACHKGLRHTVHLWVDLRRKFCPWAQAYYQKKKAEGQSHACALRCLGQQWLKIL